MVFTLAFAGSSAWDSVVQIEVGSLHAVAAVRTSVPRVSYDDYLHHDIPLVGLASQPFDTINGKTRHGDISQSMISMSANSSSRDITFIRNVLSMSNARIVEA